MFQKHGLANWRFVVDSLATVSVATGSYFIEERTVDFIHFCSIDFGESFCHEYQNIYKGKMIILINRFSFYYGKSFPKLRK